MDTLFYEVKTKSLTNPVTIAEIKKPLCNKIFK